MRERPLLVVLRALGLGDLLTALPALRALAEAFPRHRRVLAAPRWLEPLVPLVGGIDGLIDASPLRPLALDREPDVAVNLHGRGPESHRALLATRPRRLVGFAHPALPETASAPAWRADEHEVTRWCRLLAESGVAADPARLDLLPTTLAMRPEAVGATLLHPGAAHAARRWPIERWAAVARAEARAGRRVLVTAGADEADLAHALARAAGLDPGALWIGRPLLELAALVAHAGRVVVGDTGVAHLATALRIPSVVLFGPVPPALWGPPADRPWHRALWAGRSGNPHGSEPDPGLLAITVDQVLSALGDLGERVDPFRSEREIRPRHPSRGEAGRSGPPGSDDRRKGGDARLRAPLPREVQLEVTASCNLRCRMCLVRYRPPIDRRAGSMPFERFRAIIDALPDLHTVTLQGLGEPLLAPDLFRMIAYAAGRGVRMGFNTNATLLTRATATRLVDAGLDWLCISLDGATAATYEGIRDGARLGRVERNVRSLVRVLRERRAARPRISLVFVAMRRNVAELPALVRLAADWGVPSVRVQNLSHSFDDTDPAGAYREIRELAAAEALWSSPNPGAARIFEAAAREAAALGVTLRLPRLEPPARSRPLGTPGCDWPWRSAYVRHDGRVQPCCMLMGDDRGIVGDIAEESFAEIWSNARYEALRAGLMSATPPAVCAGCSMYRGAF
jgi:radical SAM protein with 4Fe4S-binding SPASM domain